MAILSAFEKSLEFMKGINIDPLMQIIARVGELGSTVSSLGGGALAFATNSFDAVLGRDGGGAESQVVASSEVVAPKISPPEPTIAPPSMDVVIAGLPPQHAASLQQIHDNPIRLPTSDLGESGAVLAYNPPTVQANLAYIPRQQAGVGAVV